MAIIASESRGAAISIYNLGSGISIWLGPAFAGVFLPKVGVERVMRIFAIMYLAAASVTLTLQIPLGKPDVNSSWGNETDGVGAGHPSEAFTVREGMDVSGS